MDAIADDNNSDDKEAIMGKRLLLLNTIIIHLNHDMELFFVLYSY